MLTDEQLQRYQAQLFLPEVEVGGQLALLQARVLVVGAGGLGCHLLPTLAGAGVGQIRLYDPDQVSLSNLPRQWLYRPSDIGRDKVSVCRDFLAERFADSDVQAEPHAIMAGNLAQAADGMTLILDCSDHLPTRLLLNDFAHSQGKALITASAIGLQGQVLLHDPRQALGCWRCLFSPMAAQPLSCSQAGILGPVVQQVAAMQAQLALSLLLAWPALECNLWRYQGQHNQWASFAVPRDPSCPLGHD